MNGSVTPCTCGAPPSRRAPEERAFTDLFDLLLATGCRIGEACALRWQDVDLDASTLTVAGTMVFLKVPAGSVRTFPRASPGNAQSIYHRSRSPCSIVARPRNLIAGMIRSSPASLACSYSGTICAGRSAAPCDGKPT
ncbi:tyrosine-type recombinase/integrase [Actinoplanes sp. NPDC026619]|uniref:tyrosine-type recombinase/integrase n=1 Tax=Actinoplanes sp. NPDC026619 TaxID=3155798 RepID=UPI0033FF800B